MHMIDIYEHLFNEVPIMYSCFCWVYSVKSASKAAAARRGDVSAPKLQVYLS
jgi:hypothetical protein